jgi:transcriptional regulator GlxA family with amidase domain
MRNGAGVSDLADALSSGFASIRRFNAAFRAGYHRSPSAERRRLTRR